VSNHWSNVPLLGALLLSILLHMSLMLRTPVEKPNLPSSSGPSMAIKLAPPVEKKPERLAQVAPEEIIATQAKAPVAIKPLKKIVEVAPEPPKPKEVEQQLENVVTREAQFSSAPTPPRYPEKARKARQEGLVLVRAQVDAQGKTQAIKIAQSSGFPLLDQAALDAVAKWNFVPAKRNDKTITAWIEVPIDFKLR